MNTGTIKEYYTRHRALLLRCGIVVLSSFILLLVCKHIEKFQFIYSHIKTAILIISAVVLVLMIVKALPRISFLYKYLKYTVAGVAGTLLTVLVFLLVWYTCFFFPDDQDYLEEVASAVQYRGNHLESVDYDLIRQLGGAHIVNPLNSEDRKFLLGDSLLEREFYIDINPYMRPANSNNLKYSTGRIFHYTSQKNCAVLKGNSSVSYRIRGAGGAARFLSMDAVFPQFSKASGEGTLRVTFGTQVLLNKKIAREVKPGIAPFRYSNPLTSIMFYLKHPGRSVLPDYTGWERITVNVPSGPGVLKIEFAGSGDSRDYLFLGTPRVYSKHEARRDNHMNIVYLLFDCLAPHHLDIYDFYRQFMSQSFEDARREIGPRNVVTPEIDRLVKDACVFENMFTVGQVTRCSIVPLWTSKFYTQSRMPVFRNLVSKENQREFYDMNFAALGEELSRRGFFTKQISCNAQGHGVSSVGADLGFDENYDYTMEPSEYPENIRRIIEYLHENQNRKFFLYSHINIPHSPRWIPLGYYLRALWDTNFLHSSARDLGNIRYLNDCFGKIMKALNRLNLRNNTMIIITADHTGGRGHLFRETVTDEERAQGQRDTQSVAYFFNRSIYVRPGGPNLFKSTLNIPFVVIKPNNRKFRPGWVKSVVSTMDISPTFLDLATGESCSRFDGKSFKKLLFSEVAREKSVFTPYIPFSGRFQRGFLLEGRYHYAINLQGMYRYREAPDGKKYIMQQEYLYDLKHDPYEINNLALDNRNPVLLEKIRRYYRQHFQDYPDKNFIQIAESADGKEHRYRFVIQSSGEIKYPRVYSKGVTFTAAGKNRMEFSAVVRDKRAFFNFETFPSEAMLKVSVYKDNTMLPCNSIFSAVENINIFSNPFTLQTRDDFFIARVPGKTGLEEVKLPKGAVYFSRIPLNYWLEMSKSERDIKLSPGIKEVLRGWGYIQ
ncbi:MAG TPA: sulfatase-like hydrolase/transferase [Spirochaetota bacterium]|nr:sulfatase-like hydrolase/transferase [Spirochaetota bacterium]